MKKSLATISKEYLIKNKLESLSYGDLNSLGDIYQIWMEQFDNKKHPHPINACNRVLNSLENNPAWVKSYFRANRGLARSFTLKK